MNSRKRNTSICKSVLWHKFNLREPLLIIKILLCTHARKHSRGVETVLVFPFLIYTLTYKHPRIQTMSCTLCIGGRVVCGPGQTFSNHQESDDLMKALEDVTLKDLMLQRPNLTTSYSTNQQK